MGVVDTSGIMMFYLIIPDLWELFWTYLLQSWTSLMDVPLPNLNDMDFRSENISEKSLVGVALLLPNG
jgi:hypothetical protein